MSLTAIGLLLDLIGFALVWLVRPPTYHLGKDFAREADAGLLTRWMLGRNGYVSGARLNHYLPTASLVANVGWILISAGFLFQLVDELANG